MLGKPPQQRGFVAIIAHEELAQPEAGGLDGADADQESAGARSAGQAGGFGIEEGPARGRAQRNGAARKRIEQVGGQLGKVRNVHAAVAAMALPELFGFEVLAMRRAHHFARDQLLDGGAFRRRCARRGRWRGRILAVDARQPLAQDGELLLDVLHASLFLCLL